MLDTRLYRKAHLAIAARAAKFAQPSRSLPPLPIMEVRPRRITLRALLLGKDAHDGSTFGRTRRSAQGRRAVRYGGRPQATGAVSPDRCQPAATAANGRSAA